MAGCAKRAGTNLGIGIILAMDDEDCQTGDFPFGQFIVNEGVEFMVEWRIKHSENHFEGW